MMMSMLAPPGTSSLKFLHADIIASRLAAFPARAKLVDNLDGRLRRYTF